MPRPSLTANVGHSSSQGNNSESLPPSELVAARRELMQQLMSNDPHGPMRGIEPTFGFDRLPSTVSMNFQRQGHHTPMHHHGSHHHHPDSLGMSRMQHMSGISMEPMNQRMYHHSPAQYGPSGGGSVPSQSHYMSSTAGPPGNASRMSSIAHQKEEELLTRLLMARSQRMQQQPLHHHHLPGDNMMASDTQSLADDLLLLRQSRESDAMLMGGQPESPYTMRSPSMQRNMGPPPGMGGPPPGLSAGSVNRPPHHHPTYAPRPSPLSETAVLRPASIVSNTPGMLSRELDDYLRKQEMSGMVPRLHSPERIDRLPPRFSDMRSHELAQHQMEMMMRAGRQQSFDQLKIPNIDAPLNSKMDSNPDSLKRKRAHKKKPADMPRRPLSAYNLFFSEERERILKEIDTADTDVPVHDVAAAAAADVENLEKKPLLPAALLRPLVSSEKKRRPHRKTHGKISFKLLAQMVGQRWKSLSEVRRKYYQDLAEEDLKRHKAAMEDYYKKQSSDGKGDETCRSGEDGDDDEQTKPSPTMAAINHEVPVASDDSNNN